ncbi:MAG TPA: pyridoxal phosphate-dependent aminotransferase [Candidatus Cryptobacteroides pullicola]|nr:pyridoxal phosphate-dependent aminotransferase [Candidatus Cryptobacteroides pullicola]
MEKISVRASNMPSSPIRKLAPFAEQAVREGVKVYHLNIGQPDIKTPECALKALKSVDRTILEYSPSDGFRSLREKMSEYYRRCGIRLAPDEIIITAGGSEAVLFAFLTCLDPGDEIIVTDPFYANYMAFAISVGAVVKGVKTHIEDGFRLPSVEELEAEITPRTKAILICNPNNPTGYLYSRSELETLRDVVVKNGLFLFCDEVYREFVYSDEPYVSAFHIGGMDGNLVLIDSVSKRYSECGTRIGCLCTRNRAVHDAVMKFCQARLSPPLIGQIVAEASIDVPQDYMKAVYDEYLGRRDFLLEGLNRISGVFSPVPKGAFYTMARLPVDDAEKFCLWCLKDFRYEGRTVMLAPGAGFYTEPGEGRDEVRIAYVLCREDLAMALTVLEKALEAYPGRTV